MTAVVEIGHGEFTFCAAHTGLHAGRFEPLHGHTYRLVLRLSGSMSDAGMVVDFGPVKTALRAVIAPLRGRTLLAAHAPGTALRRDDGRVCFGDREKHYELPAGDVTMLPLANTTTEELARYLLDQLTSQLLGLADVGWVELTLAEAPDVAAVVRRDLR
jgi:6-pyruvoyl-tetrahydropterin synthase